MHMTSGTDELHFFYDAQNRPAVVVYNGTAYAYVKSLQGDIVAILDENGNTVVSYGYDAWGARCGVLANWRKRWARCSRLGIAGMSTTKKPSCIISEVDIMLLFVQECSIMILAYLKTKLLNLMAMYIV